MQRRTLLASAAAAAIGSALPLFVASAEGPRRNVLLLIGDDQGLDKRPAEELYDLRRDPDEVDNVASSAASRDVLEDLHQRLFDFRRATRDPWLAGQTSPYDHMKNAG